MFDIVSKNDKNAFYCLALSLSPQRSGAIGEQALEDSQRHLEVVSRKWHALERKYGICVTELTALDWRKDVLDYRLTLPEKQKENAVKRYGKIDGLDLVQANDCSVLWAKTVPNIYVAAFSIYKEEDITAMVSHYPLYKTEKVYVKTGFKLKSVLALDLYDNEQLGEFKTLKLAYEAGMKFLENVTAQAFKEKTSYNEARIYQELQILPKEFHVNAVEGLDLEEEYCAVMGM